MLYLFHDENAVPTVEDQLVSTPKWVGHLNKERPSLRGEGLRRRIAGTGKQQEVLRASLTDGVHDELNGINPSSNIGNIMRLVHDTAVKGTINRMLA